MCFVTNALEQQQGGIVLVEHQRLHLISREQQLFFLRDPDGYEVGQANLFERLIGG